MFAVIKTGGKQYRIVANQVVKVEKVIGNAGDVVEFNDVLMVGQEGSAVIGTPVVADARVTAEILEQARGRKVIAFKKRRRQNSKRTRGHRQEFTTLRVLEILMGGSKPKKAAAKPIKEEATAAKGTKDTAVEKKAEKTAEKKTASQKKAAVASKSKKD
ncbi:50S ribosomal protein L21 [Bartonella tribocorum]|uniref:Large ribosomal subunit protein bL21 n=1 Tax=Bartonella tribocorum (strain DSM 28219 / CCUG 45778 / CIP 105476 / IBS 506) TaxID=382640 RepID=RL21_BART1|nr:50S ribosomal protein L21 [Bartonella tribocorum]A9IM54.1 RecName: Full=Large ribosomal subunit protein bL21; AltName: Full=50S ribosomal protein L21 [Bartonella tribocorum CIP 105476]CAK00638.1 50S ribosomal protein L21 [Bartonella tribocorum CIP 105476]CDO47828.1 50S ribosomal protein L21 [Bartonella tribocorum]